MMSRPSCSTKSKIIRCPDQASPTTLMSAKSSIVAAEDRSLASVDGELISPVQDVRDSPKNRQARLMVRLLLDGETRFVLVM
jgi:hypothetical protein